MSTHSLARMYCVVSHFVDCYTPDRAGACPALHSCASPAPCAADTAGSGLATATDHRPVMMAG